MDAPSGHRTETGYHVEVWDMADMWLWPWFGASALPVRPQVVSSLAEEYGQPVVWVDPVRAWTHCSPRCAGPLAAEATTLAEVGVLACFDCVGHAPDDGASLHLYSGALNPDDLGVDLRRHEADMAARFHGLDPLGERWDRFPVWARWKVAACLRTALVLAVVAASGAGPWWVAVVCWWAAVGCVIVPAWDLGCRLGNTINDGLDWYHRPQPTQESSRQ